MSLNNENWITGLTLTDLSPVKLIYYPLIKFSLSVKICVWNKIKIVKAKMLIKHISFDSKMKI